MADAKVSGKELGDERNRIRPRDFSPLIANFGERISGLDTAAPLNDW
jgi:hypothetical protein